jgi:Icc-related predicted phosphoesterase
MKLLVLSDLHLEFSNLPLPANDADVIVLAGDIWKGDNGIYWARSTWPDKEIVYVAGNHEFYGKNRLEVLARLRIAGRETGVHFLDNEEKEIDGVRFLGATMWTDFMLNKDKYFDMVCASDNLNDFRVIHEGKAHFSPMDSIVLHEESLAWLTKKLIDEPFEGKTVVVTHHLPSELSVAQRFKGDPLSACFASRLDHLFGHSELWVHGHTHDNFDYMGYHPRLYSYDETEIEPIGNVVKSGTRVVCNPRGYCRYEGGGENSDFNQNLIVEI